MVVTDLDGTLLDDSYPVAQAAASIERLCASVPGVQVVLASSKTFAEMQVIARHSESVALVIFENGAGIAWREGTLLRDGDEHIGDFHVQRLCLDYGQVRRVLLHYRRLGYAFTGFGDMDEAQICARTGLQPDAARRAADRLMTEPLVWHGDQNLLPRFVDALKQHGLTLQLGGRFHHASSGANKAIAFKYLLDALAYEKGLCPSVLACGDAPNDLELVDLADQAVLFPQRHGEYLLPPSNKISHAPRSGPAAWMEAVFPIVTAQEECA
ncbi:MAG: HAD-IIB family hydrolase [Pseudomonadota bacterium]